MALGMGRLACDSSCINADDDDVVVDDDDDDGDVAVIAAAVEFVSVTVSVPTVLDVIALLRTDDLGHMNCQP